MKIPLELRDKIYAMLLTTPYCAEVGTTGSSPKFRLHTAVLFVNKQVSGEAERILYQANDFVILKVLTEPCDMDWVFGTVPKFKLLSENRISSPVLRINITEADVGRVKVGSPKSFITTKEGLQAIISALWKPLWEPLGEQDDDEGDLPEPRYLRLALNFNFKAAARRPILTELVLRPWHKISGFKELILTGNIEEPMLKKLEKSNYEGPFANDVAAHLMEYDVLAEQEFEQGNFNAACWLWAVSEEYWTYIAGLKPYRLGGRIMCELDDELWDTLRKFQFMHSEGMLRLLKESLRQSRYGDAAAYAEEGLGIMDFAESWYSWRCPLFGRKPTAMMEMKFGLSTILAQTACGKTEDGKIELNCTVRTILDTNLSRSLNIDMNETELRKDLKITVDNELIRLKSPWRCGGLLPLSPTAQSGPDWELGEELRSFWEWMDLPDDRNTKW
jgi:hypothetical protein